MCKYCNITAFKDFIHVLTFSVFVVSNSVRCVHLANIQMKKFRKVGGNLRLRHDAFQFCITAEFM